MGWTMTPSDLPDGLRAVSLPKGCVVLLTPQEYLAGIRRGKWWKRRVAEERRYETATEKCTAPEESEAR
jgi:hypothetical protein